MDSRKCQTAAVSPAEPGVYPLLITTCPAPGQFRKRFGWLASVGSRCKRREVSYRMTGLSTRHTSVAPGQVRNEGYAVHFDQPVLLSAILTRVSVRFCTAHGDNISDAHPAVYAARTHPCRPCSTRLEHSNTRSTVRRVIGGVS